jgi:hypothetical protein
MKIMLGIFFSFLGKKTQTIERLKRTDGLSSVTLKYERLRKKKKSQNNRGKRNWFSG